MEADLGELANMFARNQLGFQDPKCVCDQVKEFARGGEAAKSRRNGQMVRMAIIDIAEIGRRAESDPRSMYIDGIPVRVVNEWHVGRTC